MSGFADDPTTRLASHNQRHGWAARMGVHPLLNAGALLQQLGGLAISPIAPLLADRLGLTAAAELLTRVGRPEGLQDLRDMRTMGDPAGPAAPILLAWTWLSTLPWAEPAPTQLLHLDPDGAATEEQPPAIGHTARLQDLLRGLGLRDTAMTADLAAAGVAAATLPCPLAAAGSAIGAGAGHPLPVQLLITDFAVSRCLGWPLPLYSLGLGRLERPDPDAVAVARILGAGARDTFLLLTQLGRRADRLLAAAHQVRTRQVDPVVSRLLARDAVRSAALADLLPARHSRRLLQRLVELGALRELTGRASYRLYGL